MEQDESVRRLCVLAHASALLGLILPLGQILGPYLVKLLAPPHPHEARRQAVEALNFQLNMLVLLLSLIGLFLLAEAGWWWLAIFVPNLYAFGMALFAASRASRGRSFRYPLIVRILAPPGGLEEA